VGDLEIERLHRIIRTFLPVIAAVNGVAVGGRPRTDVLCDLTAASHAQFGQSGPRVGRSTPVSVGLPRPGGRREEACQIWFLLDSYDAETAERWGLVNEVVPADLLMATARLGRKIGLIRRRHCAFSSTRSTPTPTTSAGCHTSHSTG
jgi:naphthoate synthase